MNQYSNSYSKTVYITVEGENGPEQITSNTIHPFFVVYRADEPRLIALPSEGHVYEGPIPGGAWVDAAHLRPGNHLRSPDGTLRKVISVELIDTPLQAYNLTIENTETFFVGYDGVWVHNCYTSQEKFDQDRWSGGKTQQERDTFTKGNLAKVADRNGWTKASELEKKNGKGDYYKAPDGTYRKSDATHGRFETYDKKGKHQGEVDIEGNPVDGKERDPNRDLEL